METEIKLGFIDKESLLAVADADWFRAYCIDNGDTSLLENTYLDTNDLKVTGNGAMIRVRHYSGDAKDYYEFTVKYGDGVSDGLHRRFEWNVKSDTDSFDVDGFKASAEGQSDSGDLLDKALEGVNGKELTVLCRNSFTRTIIHLKYGDSTMEACFDRGTIEDGRGRVREHICELELELVSGRVEDIEAMAGIVIDNAPCGLFNDTKYHRTLKYIDRGC
jgi:triphosphatase